MDARGNRRGGMYWVGDRPFVSVTEVLKTIDKPAIRHWYGQQVYYAMCKEPSLSEQEALAAPYRVAKESAGRGSTIHSLIEAHPNIRLEAVPQDLRGYAQAFVLWSQEVRLKVLEHEKTIVSQEYGYAGTMDMIADIAGRRYVIDFKTSKDGTVYTEAHMQVSAYKQCLEGVDGAIIVGLSPNGQYNHVQSKESFKPFLACLELYKFINQEKLMKLGYSV